MALKVYCNINELMTLKGAQKKGGRLVEDKDLSVIKNAALVVESGVIQWVGQHSRLPQKFKSCPQVDLQGQNVFPGFIDCHTHLIFSGDRRDEFEKRNRGMSYQQIAEQGGGILSTMKATRRARLQDLVEQGQKRVETHLSQGVTTVEIKSGYGLDRKSEEKMLEAAKQLKKISVVTTFLGAHAIPKGHSEESYLEQLKKDLHQIKKSNLSHRVDIFIEKGYFSIAKAKEYLQYAQSLGFDVTIHADQLNRTKATLLAIELKALSADHVINLSTSDKRHLAHSDTVAVLLPSADFYLQCDYPDARGLIGQGGCVALATDFNPGSSPSQSIALAGILARLEMKMTLAEVFVAFCVGGAKALGIEKYCGSLLPGYHADFFTSSSSWKDFFYDFEKKRVLSTYVKGKQVFKAK